MCIIFWSLILICVILLPSCQVCKWQMWILLIRKTHGVIQEWLAVGLLPDAAAADRLVVRGYVSRPVWPAGLLAFTHQHNCRWRIMIPGSMQPWGCQLKKQARSFFVWFSIIHKKRGGYFLVPHASERLTCSPPNICVLHKLTKRKFKLPRQRCRM